MPVSEDVKTREGKPGPLADATPEQIYRAHHNLDNNGKLLPGFTANVGRPGCECDHCVEYLQKKAA